MANVVPIVFCFDKRIILGASVAIKSLIDCAKDETTYDIAIINQLDSEGYNLINTISQKTDTTSNRYSARITLRKC